MLRQNCLRVFGQLKKFQGVRMRQRTNVPNTTAVRQMIRDALHDDSGGYALLLHRLDCVLLIVEGRDPKEVAEWFGVDKRTLYRWVHAVYMQGIQGLTPHRNGGRPAKITKQQEQQIRLDLLSSPVSHGYADSRWSGKRLASHLATLYGVMLSVRSCQRLIKN